MKNLTQEYERLSKKLKKLNELQSIAALVSGALYNKWAYGKEGLENDSFGGACSFREIKNLLEGKLRDEKTVKTFDQMEQKEKIIWMQRMAEGAEKLLKTHRKEITQELQTCVECLEAKLPKSLPSGCFGDLEGYKKAQKCLEELDALDNTLKPKKEEPKIFGRKDELLETAQGKQGLAEMKLQHITQEAIGKKLEDIGFTATDNADKSKTYENEKGAKITIHPTNIKDNVSETKIVWNAAEKKNNEVAGQLAKAALEDPDVKITIDEKSANKVAKMITEAGGEKYLDRLLVGPNRRPYNEWKLGPKEETKVELEIDHPKSPNPFKK